MTPPPPDSRPGGRTARTTRAVHDAVRAIVAESGAADMKMADVAERSGVHRATIYRRWTSIHGLVLDVAATELNRNSPVPATGDLDADLRTYARQLVHGISQPGGLAFLHALMGAGNDPELGAGGTALLMSGRLDQFRAMLLAAGTTRLQAEDIFDLLIAPLYLRSLLSSPSSISEADIERLVKTLVTAAEYR
jgi:AcrR family transcriptional regulator